MTGGIVRPGEAGKLEIGVPRPLKPGEPVKGIDLGTQLSPIFTTLFSDLEGALKDAATLPAHLRNLYGLLILAASALSFIPGEANLGGGLASVLIHDIIEPFRRRVYEGTIDLSLRPLFPTRDLNARLFVTGIEAGSLDVEEVIGELARAGVRPESVITAVKIARDKRFQAAVKDDLALVRTYNSELIKETIAIVKDQEKAVITDLQAKRKELVAQLGVLNVPVSA